MLFNFLLKNQSLLFYIQVLFLLNIGLVFSDDIPINDINLKFIHLSNKVIYIKNDKNHQIIYQFNDRNQPTPLYSSLFRLSKKSIIKIDEENFVVFGINDNQNFGFQSFTKSGDGISQSYSSENTGISYYNGETYNIVCSSTTICFISFINSNGFNIYRILLNNNDKQKITIEPNLGRFGDWSFNNIVCDSFDGENFFCIFIYKNKNGNWDNYYASGDINTGTIGSNVDTFCGNNCFGGNIAKERQTNRYLVCYEISGDGSVSINCKYFSFIDKVLLIEDEYEVDQKIVLEETSDKALILNIYENTVMIDVEGTVKNDDCVRLLICSLDFKITILKNIKGDSLIDLFNDDEYYYSIYKRDAETTIVKKERLIQCHVDKYIYFSQESEIQFDLVSGHTDEHIIFSLDRATKLKKDNTLVISLKDKIRIESNNQFIFVKPVEINTLKNYYIYYELEDGSTIYYNKFSLICPISLKLCYEGCKSCNLTKPSLSTENFCKECNDNYYPKISDIGEEYGYNCYKKTDKEIESYYLSDKIFYPCDQTCKTCDDSNSCNTCKSGYYFKKDENDKILYKEKCFNYIAEKYYLDNSSPERFFKPCYETCLTCSKAGTGVSNNCDSCDGDYKNYFFDLEQCTVNNENCINTERYWDFSNYNVKCISKDDCKEKSLVIEGKNKGQCVDNCKTFDHPFQKISIPYLYTFECDKQKYCLSYDTCIRHSLTIDYSKNECVTKMICTGKMNILHVDPFDDLKFTPLPPPTDHSSPDERKDEINKRIKIIKMFSELKEEYDDVLSKYNEQLLQGYNSYLQNELSNYGSETKIYLITSTRYMNFTITIYPLDIENFVYEQIFLPNDLGFANFTKMFENFIYTESDTNGLLLVCLMEYHSDNSAINDINYFIYSLNELTYEGYVIYPSASDILEKSRSQLEISYSLSNYKNDNSKINQRNKEHLVDNIKEMAIKYPVVNLSNISDPFYNDICFVFTSDVNTDMTLNDRRNEYYINVSLCENDCQIITILNKEVKTPRSLCSCDMKSRVKFNNRPGLQDYIPLISSSNSKAVSCISTAFSKNNISSNVIFWVLLLVFLFLIAMLVAWILYGKKEIRKILGIYEQNNDISDIRESFSNNEENEKVIFSRDNNNKKDNKKDNKGKKKDKKKVLAKSLVLKDKNGKKYSDNQIESQRIEYLSAPINPSNPPKKKEVKKSPTLATIDYNEKDLITNSEPSFFKNSILKANDANEKNDNNTDFSFDNMPSDNKVYIDNLLKQRYMLENNYIKNPIEYEKMQKMQILYQSLYSPEDIEIKKFSHSCDNILFSGNKRSNNKNPKGNKIERNKLITAMLGGKGLFNDNQSQNNKSDNNNIKKLDQNKQINGNNININTSMFKEEKDFDGDEQFFFPGGLLGKEGGNFLIDDDNNNNIFGQKGNKNKVKKQLNKNENNKNNESENENENENENKTNNNDTKIQKTKSKNKNKNNQMNNEILNKNARNRLLKSIGKSNFDDSEEKKDGKNEDQRQQLKTEYDLDEKNKIKRELRKIAQGEEELNSEGGIFGKKKNYRNNSFISNESDYNNLIRSNNSNILKVKSKKKMNKDNENNTDKDNNNMNNNNTNNDNKNNTNKNNTNNNNNKTHKNSAFKDTNKDKDDQKYNSKDKNAKKYNNSKNKRLNKNELSSEISSNRKMLDFAEEGNNDGDMGIPISSIDKYKKKESNENEISGTNSNKDNKSDIQMFNEKILASSISAFIETTENKPILIEENFFLFYWRYLLRRELCLVSFIDKKKTIPYFVRWSCFAFCLIFIFLLNCFFFFESNVHKRYLNALQGKKNSIGFYFKNEFINSFFVSLLSIIFKIIIIKLVLYRIFKINKDAKKLMRSSSEKDLSQNELEELNNKRNKYLFEYKLKLIIYFVSMMLLSILFIYFCICYGGVFHNSISAFFLGFLFSFIFSFILCALFCFIIVGAYWLGKKFKNKCILSIYIVLSTMY